MDLREKGFITKYPLIFNKIRKQGYRLNVLFLEADDEILIQRYSQTRRQHPLGGGNSLPDAIKNEKNLLKDLRDEANTVIDTSACNIHELKSLILEIAGQSKEYLSIRINVLSFGYKNGIPLNADLLIDVRFLKNPFFEKNLKDLNGESEEVRKYILENEDCRLFLKKYLDLLDFLIPLYEKEQRAYLTIAVGCTGGQHRSVTIARLIYEHIEQSGKLASLIHRDI
jgi:UPF0042 nucleotide-binding protein